MATISTEKLILKIIKENSTNNICMMSNSQLAEEIEISESRIMKSLKNLIQKSCIKTDRSNHKRRIVYLSNLQL